MSARRAIPDSASAGSATDPRLVTPTLLREWRLPTPTGTKTSRGQVLVIGGARRTPGAPMLSGRSALRMGAGRLTLAVAESVAVAVAVALPESGVHALPEGATGSVTGENAGDLLEAEITRSDAVLIGPGLDDADGTVRLLEEVIPLVPKRTPVVLDAYGFTVLPQVDQGVRASLSGRLVANCNPGELAMVVGREDLEAEDVPEPALEVAADLGAVLSCHGWLVSDEGGVWQVTSGDTGLGTSGSGDVLAGALAGLLSRGAERRHAAVWAAYVHAAAGDNLAARFGRIGFLASDLLPELPQVLSALRGD